MIRASNLLGVGLYSPADAALYARVPTQLLTRWVYGTKSGDSVIEPQVDDSDDRIITFLDFVQTLAIRRIRQERRISLEKIRQAYHLARDQFGVEYPFALDTTRIGLFGPPRNKAKQEIWICVGENDEGARKYFQLTGRKRNNQLIGEVVLTYARRLVFDETGLAREYKAFDTSDGNVLMNPDVRFGEPYLESCGYTARTLFEAYQTEGSLARVAELYGVSERDVTLAIEYFDHLRPANAA